jgi:hypothetical protein
LHGTRGMNKRHALLVASLVLAACGATTAELYRQEVAAVDVHCKSLPHTPGGFLAKERKCQEMLRTVTAKHQYEFDGFIESILAYRLAVAERLDNNEITIAQAESLEKEYQRRMVMERQRMLTARRSAEAAGRIADVAQQQADATKRAEDAAWQSLPDQSALRSTPIRCTTLYRGIAAYTNCR